jgi:hypothetical protein
LSATVIEADRAPAACGVNVTVIVQVALTATLAPHVLVWLKSAAFTPVIEMPVIDNAPEPPFESVSVCGALVVFTFWLANKMLAGFSETCGTPIPVPLSPAVCGESEASSVTVTEAERAPAAWGENVTEIVQLPPIATLAPQVLVWLKSEALVPVIAMLAMETVEELVFDNVIVWAPLVVPIFWFPKARLVGASVI